MCFSLIVPSRVAWFTSILMACTKRGGLICLAVQLKVTGESDSTEGGSGGGGQRHFSFREDWIKQKESFFLPAHIFIQCSSRHCSATTFSSCCSIPTSWLFQIYSMKRPLTILSWKANLYGYRVHATSQSHIRLSHTTHPPLKPKLTFTVPPSKT